MPPTLAPLFPPDAPIPEELLQVLLNVSLTGVILFRPVYAADVEAVTDLAYVRLNPAAQQMLRLPECPAESFLTLYPTARTTGIFAFYRDAFLSGQVERYQVDYQYEGLDGYFQLVAQRAGPLLVVSFTDTNDQPRTALEEALRTSQAREQTARAETELQRRQLNEVLMQAPAMICIFDGPEHQFQFVNPPYQALVGERPLLGKPIAVAMPELAGQPIFGLLDRVYQTGESFHATEMLVQLDHGNDHPSELEKRYYNFIYQARRDLRGAIDGILVFAYEVTTQVQARQAAEESTRQQAGLNRELDALNEELAAANEELAATNEEYLTANTALEQARQQLQHLNEELETRVAARTQETQAALREAQDQREQLRMQQGLLSQILGQVPAAIATVSGPEHRFSFFNEHYQRLVGGRARLGQPVADTLPEVVSQGFVGLLDKVYATGQPFIGTETPMQLRDDTSGHDQQHYLDLIYQPLFDAQQQPQGILAFVVDVTDKVLARQQADTLQAAVLAAVRRRSRERENVYQLFEQAPAAIALLREPDHRIDYHNPAYQALFPGRELRGHTIVQVQPESEAQGFIALLDAVYQTGQLHQGTEVPLTITQPHGQPPITHYFNFTYQAYREEDKIVGVSVFAFDVTLRVLARREAELQRRLLDTLFMEAPAPICTLDGPEFVYQLVNPAYQQLFPGRKLQGKPVLEALPELADSPVPALLTHVYQTGETYRATELPLAIARYENGPLEDGYFTFIYQARHDAHGTIDGILVFAFEVTDQLAARRVVEESGQRAQALADELSATNDRLTRTNTDLDTFVYTASHDLKAPITNIEGLLTALREQLPAAALQAPLVERILALMQDSVARFQQTIAHLTDLSQVQYPAAPDAETVDVAALVEAVSLDLAPLVYATGTRLTAEVPLNMHVKFAPKNLRSIVYNLLSNAIKYQAPGRTPQVALRCYQADNQVVLAVQDNGLGLTPTEQAKLFGMFRRLHTHVEGSGVGLYMTKRLVENAGGTIQVQSEVGVGSTFTVYLPG
ncbi:MAG: PAS domain-containing protein [Janthinobacterium lividum]